MLGYNLNTTGIPKMFIIKMTHSLSHKIHQYDFLLLAEHLYTGVFLLSLHIHYRRINRHIVFGSISNTLDCYLRFGHPFSIKNSLSLIYIFRLLPFGSASVMLCTLSWYRRSQHARVTNWFFGCWRVHTIAIPIYFSRDVVRIMKITRFTT